ncbi:MAG TPA: hypothetical protein PK413_12280, partial [Thermoanaerobaculia bacterium]|nr:hypothetical protein [Thermoanaerobaculia bacterium]
AASRAVRQVAGGPPAVRRLPMLAVRVVNEGSVAAQSSTNVTGRVLLRFAASSFPAVETVANPPMTPAARAPYA